MSDELTPHAALNACCAAAGSASKLARDLGVTQPRVWRWINVLRQLPAEFVLRAERLYGVSRHWLRPDIYPVDLPPAPSRFVGVDRRASRGVALDRLANGVALDRMSGTKEASL